MKTKEVSTDLCSSADKSLSNWDEAIAKAKAKLAQIKRSIRGMEELRDQGMRFPTKRRRRRKAA